MEDDFRHPPSSILNPRLSGFGRVRFPIPFGCLGDESLFDGAGGHAYVADFAVGHDRFYALQIHMEFALGDSGDVRADAADFLSFTRAPDDAALHRAFAGQFTNACHKFSFVKSREGYHQIRC